jgi:hypothetical protein
MVQVHATVADHMQCLSHVIEQSGRLVSTAAVHAAAYAVQDYTRMRGYHCNLCISANM